MSAGELFIRSRDPMASRARVKRLDDRLRGMLEINPPR